ncbi:MAG: P-II family nitrogen regulator [Clostridia bacterium]|nr:P-II family nitrogen regulator [Clostridia bacterium]
MKEIEFIIKPEKMENLKRILNNCGAHGMIVTYLSGYGHQGGVRQVYTRDEVSGGNLLPKLSFRTVVPDNKVEIIINKVVEELNTGSFGDGKIFVRTIDEVVQIRTGIRGKEAL